MSDEREKTGPECEPEPVHEGGNGRDPAAGTTAAPDSDAVERDADAQVAEQIQALRREFEDVRDQYLRSRAEFDNFKKRVERDRALAGQDALARALTALVPTLDNLERALGAEAPEGALRDGVRLIHRDLLAALESLGLRTEDPRGAMFDPERHQALTHESVPGHAEGTVVEVFGKGYALGDRLLRPAMVKVAKGDPDPTAATPETLH